MPIIIILRVHFILILIIILLNVDFIPTYGLHNYIIVMFQVTH